MTLPTATTDERLIAFRRLLDIMDELREKCPWDREQTFESLRTLTIEETYELADAILTRNMSDIKKELGDEEKQFNITDVISSLCDKLVYRHPHVFGEVQVNGSEQVVQNWEQLKIKEKDGNKAVLSGVPTAMPALAKANRIQEKVAAVGFDWEERHQVWDKVKEELAEVQQEIENANQKRIEQEFGDLFFSLVNAARLYGIDPEAALERTNQKFKKRFGYLEQKTIKQGQSLKAMSLDEMNKIWEEAKAYD